jgi:hypothetical protein
MTENKKNIGVAPPDISSDTGKMRVALGDSEWTDLNPPEEGLGAYQIFSDNELIVFLDIADGSVPRAISMAYRQIGASWASSGATIKTDDLTYSAKDSVDNWLKLAEHWDKVARDKEENATNIYFDIIEPIRRGSSGARAEASPCPVQCVGCAGGYCGLC